MTYRTITLIIITVLLLAGCATAAQQTPPEDKSLESTATPQPVSTTPTPTAPEASPPVEGPEYSPLDPLPEEQDMIRGGISIGASEVILLESFPVQVSLKVSGMLPTPCNMPRAEVTGPDENNRISVEMWTLTDPDAVCIQVLQPFEISIPLGSFESGSYSVYLNGEEVGDISL